MYRVGIFTFLYICHTTNVLLFKFRCSIFIVVRSIKEMPGSVASGTLCIMWKEYGTPRQATDGNIIRCIRFAFLITKATDKRSKYVILLAFPRQQWLRERSSMLRYKDIVCLVQL